MNMTPEFNDAMQRNMQAARQYGHDHPISNSVFCGVVEFAPLESMQSMGNKAKELGLMWESRRAEGGAPASSPNETAVPCSLDPDEAKQHMNEMTLTIGCGIGVHQNITKVARN